MLRLVLLMMCLALFAGSAAAAPSAARVRELLAPMTFDVGRQADIEGQLVALGKTAAPALQAVLPELRAALAAAQTTGRDEEILPAQRRLNALDEALARLTWGFSPREALTGWLKARTFPDGSPFEREADPISLADPRLAAVLPGIRVYLVSFPPYRGGAAPPDFVLQRYAVPPPLARLNLLAVDTRRAVHLMTTPDEVTAFFQTHRPAGTPPVTPAHAAAAYLRLVQGFYWWNDQPLAFTIDERAITTRIVRGEPATTVATAVACVAPTHGNQGSLTAVLTFDGQGALLSAVLTEALQLHMEPMLARP